ncbi:acyltransferase family protein [Roseateles amylovorans]|uniref:Acyltransferase n=1 Tax=Roseateles amylovorans TaxID=2978473 RepID=A0ABY6AZY3_9BURK|nr:acyltransferase family protein [Roseateles amylovorans]UXH78355.1 acyltransferase [Roseateles amylovorans]
MSDTLATSPASSRTADTPLRADIQILRAVAVLWVLAYHAQLPGATGGYLGVDIFFVVSGFLITGLIQRALLQDRFSFAAFYGRRARRLLPAAYGVLALTLLAAPWTLNRSEQLDLVSQTWGALGFANNIVLWQQTGYFQGASELKPLLHFWSLALEEQYYLLLPALLVFTRSSARWVMLVALTVVSGALLLLWQPQDASAAFYLLPTRAWELGLGSIGALLADRLAGPRAQGLLRALAWPAWALLLLVPAAPQVVGAAHPGPAAAIVNLATLVLLLRTSASVPRWTQPLVRIGDASYALYLVHWPLLAMLHNAWVGVASAGNHLWVWRLGAVALAGVLAAGLHVGVERPAKHALTGRRGAAWLISGTVLIALGAWALKLWTPAAGAVDFVELRRPNYGLSANCDAEGPFEGRADCRSARTPRWLIWGDSYAMHLVPGLVDAIGSNGLVQATKSSCGPFPGVTPVRPELGEGHSFAPPWIAQCAAFNASVLSWLTRHPEIDTVVLSSLLTQYLDAPKYELQRTGEGQRIRGGDAMAAAALKDLRTTVQRLTAMGKRVVFIAPPPSAPFDIAACLEREQAGRWTLGATPGCAIEADEDLHRRAAEHRFVTELSEPSTTATVLRFEPQLCRGDRCDVTWDGVPLYRDAGHLSREGSRLLLPPLLRSAGLAEQVRDRR